MPSYYIAQDRFGNYDLTHHGIKGQKWGVRRYQNSDGTLTSEGKKRYTESGYVKGLNLLDRDIAVTKHKKALNAMKIEKAAARGDKEKLKELRQLDKDLDKSISDGQKAAEKIIKDAKSNNIGIGSRDSYRYTNTGKMMVGAFIAGPFGTIPVAAVDLYRSSRYGNEAGGIVKGKKYYLMRG